MENILVVRNDKIGDFILIWPAIALLKESLSCRITVLVPEYTSPLAHLCSWVDSVILDPGEHANWAEQWQLLRSLREQKFDASICFVTSLRNALLMQLAAIPERYAPMTGASFWLHNHCLRQKRSQSIQPEFAYNLDLAHFMLQKESKTQEIQKPYLDFSPQESLNIRKKIADKLQCDFYSDWVFIHMEQGGSAPCWPAEHYQALAWMLWQAFPDIVVIFTTTPAQYDVVKSVQSTLNQQQCPAYLYCSTQGLDFFVKVLSCAQMLIAGSTGPLHIAGAMNIPTVGFYPRHRSGNALRWRTLNTQERRLNFMPPHDAHELDLKSIDPLQVFPKILPWAEVFLSSPTALRIWQKWNVPITDSIKSRNAHRENRA